MSLMRISAIVGVFGVIAASAGLRADDWPQWRGPKRDGVWRETGIIEKFPAAGLKPVWSSPIGPGYSGPTVAAGRVYVTDRQKSPAQVERVHCLDAGTGKSLWTHTYPCTYRIGYSLGPRASVTVDDGRAYALGAMGHLHCLDAAKGAVLWKRDLKAEYKIRMPIWGIAAAPLVDGDRLIVQVGGAGGACLVAFDKKTGKELWRALNDRASYSAPVIVTQGGKRVLVCWTADSAAGLDPETGKVHWRYPTKPVSWPMNVHTPIVQGERLFLTSFFDGAWMLRLSAKGMKVEKIWHRRGASERKTDALQSCIGTAYMAGDYVYGVDSYGQFRCIRADNGRRVWEDLTVTNQARWSTVHMIRNGERMWIFNERGDLIIARLSPKGFHEIGRAKLIEPTSGPSRQRSRVCWAHPAFAGRCVFARNDREIICVNLAAAE